MLNKKYGLLGMEDWWVDSNAVAIGSADKAVEGKRCCRSTRLQSFEAITRFRIMSIFENLTLGDTFAAQIGKFSNVPFPSNT